MDCFEQETIEHYISGRLEAARLVEFESHLEACERCKAKLDEARDNENLLSELRTFEKGWQQFSKHTNEEVKIATIDRAQSLLGDRYRVIRKVGEGSAGHVFQALDTVLERLVAVKFLRQKSPSDRAEVETWREARLMSRFNHPNIAQIYEIGELDSKRFIVMEWIDGLILTEAWKGLQIQQRLRIYLEVLDAVAAAHRRGIIHRDIKPSNILVTAELKPKVLDFGIALETRSLESIEQGLYRGTPAYSAPEQITAPVKIYPATDVFALGILLYQLLTDTLPFPQTEPQQLFEAIRTEYPELPSALQEKIPIPLQNICLKALEKEPQKRYPDAQGLSDDINRYLRGERVWSRPSFLTDKIQQEVFYHRQKLKVWQENELITEKEFDKLEGVYAKMLAPSDPSIIEARKLSLSQVCLYLGGWIVVLGSFVLFYKTWEQIPIYLRPTPAIIATLVMILSGFIMWYRNESRLSVGFLATAGLLIPITTLLTLGQWEILSAKYCPWGMEPVYKALYENQSHVIVGNLQMYLSFWFWLSFSLIVLRLTKSSIFVVYSILAFLFWLTTCFVINGMEKWSSDIIAGRYLFAGFSLFVLGIILDRYKRMHYAWSLCIVGFALIVIPLSVIAISNNTLFIWLLDQPPSFLKNHNEAMALSFICNGLFYLILAVACRLLGTILQKRLAEIFSWLGPLHILAVLRILDSDKLDLPELHRLIYRILLPIASVAFVFGSVIRQMKSYFFSGFAGIGASVHKFTVEHLDKYFAWPVSLIITGIIWMFFSFLVPRWKASIALKRKK
jgi:serine/threonine protein kinase